MAKVLGFNPPKESYVELHDTIRLQKGLIEELVKLNAGYEQEVKRLVGEYDNLYEQYKNAEQLLKHYDPSNFGYPKVIDKDIMKRRGSNRNIKGIEFIDFSK
jgi:hypothetical protein